MRLKARPMSSVTIEIEEPLVAILHRFNQSVQVAGQVDRQRVGG